MPLGKHTTLKLSAGLRRYEPQSKEETYGILRRNLYGTPSAGNAWATLRDRRLMERFNVDLWQCNKSVMDPTLFYIRHGGFKLTERRLTKRSTKRGDQVCYEDFNPKDFDSFN